MPSFTITFFCVIIILTNKRYEKGRFSLQKNIKNVDLFTDGSSSGNPGPGGYGAILRFNGIDKEISGGEVDTTNNRMEMMAVIKGLESLKEPCNVSLYSDSKYVINSLEKGWAMSWQKNNWRKADRKPALNSDLWEILLELTKIHNLTFHWVKGHAGHPENERADKLAVSQTEKYKNMLNF